jgi:hypothetical protein
MNVNMVYHSLDSLVEGDEDLYSPKNDSCKRCGYRVCCCVELGMVGPPPVSFADPEQLARALFETDPEVVAFVRIVSESSAAREWKGSETCPRGAVSPESRAQRAMQVAWDRDEQGWTTRSRQRAETMVEVLSSKI